MIKEKRIINGNYILLYSRRIELADSSKSIDFELELGNDNFPIELSFSFVIELNTKPSYKIESVNLENGFRFNFILVNFDNILGTGTKKPIPIMERNTNGEKKDISIVFFAYHGEETNHIIEVSLFEEI